MNVDRDTPRRENLRIMHIYPMAVGWLRGKVFATPYERNNHECNSALRTFISQYRENSERKKNPMPNKRRPN